MPTRFETFSYLPPLSSAQVQAQVEYILNKNLVPVVEYAESTSSAEMYWREWPTSEPENITATWVMTQVESCTRRNPYAYVRLSGYDCLKRVYALSFIVKAPLEATG